MILSCFFPSQFDDWETQVGTAPTQIIPHLSVSAKTFSVDGQEDETHALFPKADSSIFLTQAMDEAAFEDGAASQGEHSLPIEQNRPVEYSDVEEAEEEALSGRHLDEEVVTLTEQLTAYTLWLLNRDVIFIGRGEKSRILAF